MRGRTPADSRGSRSGGAMVSGRRDDVPAESKPLRGMLSAIAMAVLAVAAHGVAGGGYPDSAGLALLLVATAAIGAIAAVAHSPIALPALMALGQPVCHVALSGLAHSGHASGARDFAGDGMMAAAHAAAAVLFAVLILAVERLYGIVSQAVRAVLTRPAPVLVPRGTSRWAADTVGTLGRMAAGANGSRAPPVAV